MPPCPICGGSLRYRDSRKRIRQKEGGVKEHLQIRRFRCRGCGALHNELPDCLTPHKHYETEVIAGVIEGTVSDSDLDSEDFPSRETMERWLEWFRINRQNIEGILRRVCGRLNSSMPLLDILRIQTPSWLETALRIIYNSGERLVPAG